MVYIFQCKTSYKIWESLKNIHKSQGHQTIILYIRNLYHTKACKGKNITNHLVKLKQYLKCINLIADNNFHISDTSFKIIISLSLPTTWDSFIELYISGQLGNKE